MQEVLRNLSSIATKKPSQLQAWIETGVLTLLMVLLGIWFHPIDPFLSKSEFPWFMLAPLLSGLRHGFAQGFGSASILVSSKIITWYFSELPDTAFPTVQCFGFIIVGMLAGEFCDLWGRNLQKMKAASEYSQQRLDEFTRTYHMLKVSHDRLEHRLMGNSQSMRGCLLSMRNHLSRVKTGRRPVLEVGSLILDMFANYGWVQIATLFEVDKDKNILMPPAADMGKSNSAVNIKDSMLIESLKSGKMISVNADSTGKGRRNHSSLLAVIPLKDITERVWGLVAVQEMPFLSFHDDNLKFLAVLGGHMGDIFMSGSDGRKTTDVDELDFIHHIKRSIEDARMYDLPSAALGIMIHAEHVAEEIADMLITQRRGLDRIFTTRNQLGVRTIFIHLPQTDTVGLQGYITRIEDQVQERHGLKPIEAGMVTVPRIISGGDTEEEVMEFFRKVCQVHETETVDTTESHIPA